MSECQWSFCKQTATRDVEASAYGGKQVIAYRTCDEHLNPMLRELVDVERYEVAYVLVNGERAIEYRAAVAR